ncbi:FAD-dependent monooxygenase [Piscinibacter sp. HJYY11]|nr:FAD-dependent monooxygenase [Piscinibacter sp. HJYY11]
MLRPMSELALPLRLAVVGAGPVGLSLALHAARALPHARISLFDSRAATQDVAADPRTLALSLGSVQLLQRLGAWDAERAQAITEVHVSQQAPSLGGLLVDTFGEPEVRISAAEERVPLLGAVLSYGAIVAPLQAAWLTACEREPGRLQPCFGATVRALKPLANGVEVDAGIVDTFDLVVVAEGGIYTGEAAASVAKPARPPLRHDYGQHAWVGTVQLANARAGVAYERFTRHGPAALLPLKDGRAALVWCVNAEDDPVLELNDTQRLAVLNTLFHPEVGPLTAVSPLKCFQLGLVAERTLTQGRTVRIGNAAQTLHPVAGQGLNLGLRDGFELVQALARSSDVPGVLRKLEWQRAPDRWAMIAATDFLARSFTWKLPGAGAARGLGLAALQALKPVKSALARQMMYGSR